MTTPILETVMRKSSGCDRVLDKVFHPGHIFVRDLKPGPGRGLHVDRELSGIGTGEERKTQQRKECEADHKRAHQHTTVTSGHRVARRTSFS